MQSKLGRNSKAFDYHQTNKKIKQEFTSDFEDDPEGSSGAEVKGNSDYKLPTDIAEYENFPHSLTISTVHNIL